MSEKTTFLLDAEGDPEVRQALDLLVPPLQVDDRRNWRKLVADAEAEATRTRLPRLVLPRGRRLRIAIVVAIIAIAILIPALAIGSGLWSPQGPPVPPMGHPMTPVVSIASGFGNGQRWQLTAYMTQRLGMCVGIDLTGNFCGAGVIGEPAELYPSGKAPNHELSGGTMMSGGFADALGLAAKDVKSVSLRLLSGEELPATMVAAPARLGADVSIYYRILTPAEAGQVDSLIARAADGTVLEKDKLDSLPSPSPQSDPGIGHPTTPPIAITSGTAEGSPWKLNAYVSKESGLCLALLIEGTSEDLCKIGVLGEPADLHSNGNSSIFTMSPGEGFLGTTSEGIVYGPAAKGVASVSIRLQSGVELPATLVPAPPGLGVGVSIYSATFSASQAKQLQAIVARSADGTVLQEEKIDPLLPRPTLPGPPPPTR